MKRRGLPPSNLTPEERATILEHDAGLSREEAEEIARREVLS